MADQAVDALPFDRLVFGLKKSKVRLYGEQVQLPTIPLLPHPAAKSVKGIRRISPLIIRQKSSIQEFEIHPSITKLDLAPKNTRKKEPSIKLSELHLIPVPMIERIVAIEASRVGQLEGKSKRIQPISNPKIETRPMQQGLIEAQLVATKIVATVLVTKSVIQTEIDAVQELTGLWK